MRERRRNSAWDGPAETLPGDGIEGFLDSVAGDADGCSANFNFPVTAVSSGIAEPISAEHYHDQHVTVGRIDRLVGDGPKGDAAVTGSNAPCPIFDVLGGIAHGGEVGQCCRMRLV